MIINRQNYQIWITDYYDGRLDDFQAEVLMDFLSDNPDLRPEFEDYPGLSVSPPEGGGADKSLLFHTPDELTNDQVEHFSIAYCENDLDENQKKEIEGLAQTDPRFRKNINIYEKIKLKADETEYPGKAMLLRIPGRRKRTGIILTSLSAAASVAILAGLFLIFNRQSTEPSFESQVLASVNEEQAGEKSNIEEPSQPGINEEEAITAQPGGEKVQSRSAIVAESLQKRPVTVTERQVILASASVESIQSEPAAVKREVYPAMSKIPAVEEVQLDKQHVSYLLAETRPYPVSLPQDLSDSLRMSVREFLAFHFRKNILDEEEPGIENLKAWEIADAGIKGINTLLGWNMEFQTLKGEDGRLQNLHFTSELVKIDHEFKKNNQGL